MTFYNIFSGTYPSAYLRWEGLRRGLVRDSNGNLWAGYCKGGYNVQRPYIKKSTDNGVTWGSEEDVSGVDDSWFSAMCIDSNDSIFVLYTIDNDGSYVRKRTSGGSWQTPVKLDSAEDCYAMAVDSNDNLYAIVDEVIDSVDYLRLYKSINNGSSWSLKSTPLSDESGYAMDIAIDSNDDVHVVLSDHYRKSTDGGASWGNSEDTGHDVAGGISLLIDGNDIPHILKDWGNGNEIRYVNRIGGSWTGETKLADDVWSGGYELFITLCIDRAGTLYALWCSGIYQESIALRVSFNNGLSWYPKTYVYYGEQTNYEQVWYPYSMNSIWPKISGVSTNLMVEGWNCVMWNENWDTNDEFIKYGSGIYIPAKNYGFIT